MNTEQAPRPANDEIDLRVLMAAIAKGKWVILATTTLFTVLAVFYALSLPNIYKSEVTLAPASESGGLNIPGQLGGLAALAGVDLGGKGGDKTGLAIEIFNSRDFIGRFIEKNDLYVQIMAAKGWNRDSNTLVIDETIYNERSKRWVREMPAPFRAKPSAQETYEVFIKMLSINQDKKTGIIKLSIEYYSPILAKFWVDKLVESINEEMRMRDLTEAERSITYLNTQISLTNIADFRSMLYSLIEEQTKIVMLANVRQEYVFKTIDPAITSESSMKPKRSLIVLSSIVLGFIISILFVFTVAMLTRKK